MKVRSDAALSTRLGFLSLLPGKGVLSRISVLDPGESVDTLAARRCNTDADTCLAHVLSRLHWLCRDVMMQRTAEARPLVVAPA